MRGVFGSRTAGAWSRRQVRGYLHSEEVSGSNPLSSTRKSTRLGMKPDWCPKGRISVVAVR